MVNLKSDRDNANFNIFNIRGVRNCLLLFFLLLQKNPFSRLGKFEMLC